MTRDRSEWLRDDERLPVDLHGSRSPAGSAPDSYGGQDGYVPRARRARHAARDDAYGRPGAYGPPDRASLPEPYGRPDSYGRPEPQGLPDPYGLPEPRGRPDSPGRPEPYSRPEPYGRPDDYGPPDAGRQTDPLGQPAHGGRPDPFAHHDAFGPPDPIGGWQDYRQQDWRAGQDPLGGQAGYRQDVRAPQDRHRGRDDDGLTDPGGRPGGAALSRPRTGGHPDPYASPPGRHGRASPEPDAPSSDPYRWRPPADLGGQESPPSDLQAGRGRRTGDWNYPGQEPGATDRGQLSGEQGAWQAPVRHDAGWNEPAPGQAGWHQAAGNGALWPGTAPGPTGWHEPAGNGAPWPETAPEPTGWQQPGNGTSWQQPASNGTGWNGPAGEGTGWHEPVTDGTGWQQPVGHDPVRHTSAPQEPVRPGPGWEQPAGDDQDWQHQEEPDSGFLPGFSDGTDGGRGTGRRRRRLRIRWVAPLVAFIVILAALGGAGNYLFRRYEASHANYQGAGTGSVLVHVLPGDSAILLAPRLVRLGVIKAVGPFNAAAKTSRSLAGLQPGYFRLRKHMNAALAYAMLVNPKSRVQVAVTIPEGLRDSQVISTLSAKTGIPAGQFTRALKSPAALGLPSYAGGSPEGYLFPATYDIQPRATATGILQQMVQSFNQEATTIDLAGAAKRAKISESHLIIVASLVQAEGGRLQDFPKIARVIYNRLAARMPLQLDSTVMFAMNKYGIRATAAQLQFNSPYNTYQHTGLPPGPIDSPGDAAIKAALHPAAGNWKYFVTVDPKTGLTKFTNSQREFARFVQELNHNLATGK